MAAEERTALLPSNESDEDATLATEKEDAAAHSSIRKGGPFGTFFNLANCAIGAGILGLPFAFSTMGIGLTLIFWVVISSCASYTLSRLIATADRTGQLSYEELVEFAFGPWVLRLIQVIMVATTFGTVVGYLVIVGDLLPPVLAVWTDTPLNSGAWFLRPDALEGLTTALIILPLALLRRIDGLKWSSMFAILAATYFVILVIVLAAIDFQSRGATPPYQGGPKFFIWSINMFQGIPILFFAGGGHLQGIQLYRELTPEHRNLPTWDSIVVLVESGLLSVYYLLVGGVSYCRFYPVDNGNILKVMIQNDQSISIQVASVAVVIVVILSAPLNLFPMRQALDKLLFRGWPSMYTELSWKTQLRFYGMTLVLVGTIYAIAALVGNLTLVFGLTGAIGATTLKVIVPAACSLKCEGYSVIDEDGPSARPPLKPLARWEKILNVGIILFGLLMGGISTFVVIAKAV